MRARYFDPATGTFLGEDPSGFNDGVNFYRYVHNDPIDNSDPTGLTTYKGFPADKEADLRNAVNDALKKLRDTCSTGQSCAGKDGQKIANTIENATFVYQSKSKLCGHTGPVTFLQLRHTFGLGPAAFGPSVSRKALSVPNRGTYDGKLEVIDSSVGLDRQTLLMSTEWSASAMAVFSSYFRKGIPTGGVLGQVKLVICYWPNTGQRVANGTIPLQLRARNSNKTREQR
jgi:hypothetical protein